MPIKDRPARPHDDEEQLQRLGYAQVLLRDLGGFGNFALTCCEGRWACASGTRCRQYCPDCAARTAWAESSWTPTMNEEKRSSVVSPALNRA